MNLEFGNLVCCAEKPLTDEEWVQKYIDGTLNPRAGKTVFDEESVGNFGPTVSADAIHRRYEARLKHIVEGETRARLGSDSTLQRSRDKN
ncbi:hypothetical protein OROHE_001020 [Orobanche hederae]